MAKELETQGLVTLKWDRPDYEVPVIMLWHAEKWCSPLLKTFMETARKIMAKAL